MTDIIDLIALKQAFASGHIEIELAPEEYEYPTWCPPDPACDLCPFATQCDRPAHIHEQYTHLSSLPEWQLTLKELAQQYPEYFI